MTIIAIDPGTLQSALVVLEPGGCVSRAVMAENHLVKALLVELLDRNPVPIFALEIIEARGMPMGTETIVTAEWVGRFTEAAEPFAKPIRVKRSEVKQYHCGSSKAKDSNIRQAIVDRYGGKDAAIGRKASPGALYGISGDEWQALAVALLVQDQATQARAA